MNFIHVDGSDIGIFENVLSFNPQLSTKLVEKTTVLQWILNRIQRKEHDENRGYAAELLSILLQDNQKNRLEFGKADGVEILLKTLSVCLVLILLFNDVLKFYYSNTDVETLGMLMRLSLWTISSTRCVRH